MTGLYEHCGLVDIGASEEVYLRKIAAGLKKLDEETGKPLLEDCLYKIVAEITARTLGLAGFKQAAEARGLGEEVQRAADASVVKEGGNDAR